MKSKVGWDGGSEDVKRGNRGFEKAAQPRAKSISAW
jgi:hypothetical protein